MLFAILISITFGFAFNSVQSNTICAAAEHAFGFNHIILGGVLTVTDAWLSSSEVFNALPVSAALSCRLWHWDMWGWHWSLYILNITHLPGVIALIVSHAFGWEQALGRRCRYGADAGYQARIIQQ